MTLLLLSPSIISEWIHKTWRKKREAQVQPKVGLKSERTFSCWTGGSFCTRASKGRITHGEKLAPSYSPPDCMYRFAQSSCVGMRRGDRARQWERSEEESFSNLATNICISQSTGVLFFARFYLSAQTKWGGKGLKCLKIWASACLCLVPPHPWNPQHE